jgi:hypothetical protein
MSHQAPLTVIIPNYVHPLLNVVGIVLYGGLGMTQQRLKI